MDKKRIRGIVLKIAIVAIIIVIFFVINDQINYEKRCEVRFISDSNAYAYQIENIRYDDDDVIITGWFFELKSVRNIQKEVEDNKKLGIVLYDLKAEVKDYYDGDVKYNKGIALNVKTQTRNDINEYFKCKYDYSQCGFEARIDKSAIDIANGQYQIIIKPERSLKDGIQTETYINGGKIQYIAPKDVVELDVVGTDLEEIVNSGYCLVSIPEKNIFVYQFGNKLYWIADIGFCFDENNKTFIEYQLETTQFEKLPQDRTANGWFWDNDRGMFELYEVTEGINCGKYRVSVRELTKEYAISRIFTGCFVDDNNKWEKYFRPILFK